MKWSLYWKEIEPRVRIAARARIVGACGGTCAEDICQEIALRAWLAFEDGVQHSPAYWATRAGWRSVDVLRSRMKELAMDEVPDAGYAPPRHGVYEELVAYLGQELADLLISGMSLTDCARVVGVSKATMSRKWTQAKGRAVAMNLQITRKAQSMYVATLDGVPVVAANYDADVDELEMESGDILSRQAAVRERVYRAMLAEARADHGKEPRVGSTQTAGDVAPSPRRSPGAGANTAPEGSSATEGKEEAFTTPLQQAIEGGFPGGILEWSQMCGGTGFCLGGSGKQVKGTYAQGWNAKLKSALRAAGTPEATQLAVEMRLT